MADNSEFMRSMEKATAQMILDMEKKVGKACLVVETQAKQDCPVDQGLLRASITSETEVTGEEITGRIGSNLEYAPYWMEMGERRPGFTRRRQESIKAGI